MSGICGILCFGGGAADRSDLDRQLKRMAHLGPDRVAGWAEGPIALGHLLMRITREDAGDFQPLHGTDAHTVMVADLRLDNREEIASALGLDSSDIAGMADSRLLQRAWDAWGENCVDHLLGDFAFAVWDAGKQELTLVLDHMGQRHLYYHLGQDFFAFASEVKGLWALPQVPRELDEDRVIHSLLQGAPEELGGTDFCGIKAVPGASIIRIDTNGCMTSRQYWRPHADPAHLGKDEAYYLDAYRKILTEAVECRLRRANVTAGLMMGGGFDSSAICALSGPIVSGQRRKLVAVSSVAPEEKSGILKDARRWCEMCRRDMPHLDMRYVTGEGVDIFTFMEGAFHSYDNRHSPRLPITQSIFRELASAGVRIVMDGHGGDYTINPRGRMALARMLWKGEWRRFLREFAAARRHLGQTRRRTLVKNVLLPALPLTWLQVLNARRHGLPAKGVTMPIAQELRERQAPEKQALRSPAASDPRIGMQATLCRMQDGQAQGYSVAGAAHGLEFTQPFHDKRVIELALAIPEELHFKNGRTRHLARTALKGLYPPEYQHRPPGSDSLTPDFLAMAKRAEPRILAEIDRMEKSGRFAHQFDFDRMREMLTARSREDHPSGPPLDVGQATLAFITARYIEWFRGDNR